MKKYIFTLALILCLVLCVFAFASCSKTKKGASTTAADTTPATAAAGSTGHVHTPADEYTVDVEPTCVSPGSKSKHCTVCREIIPETVAEVPALPHTPDDQYSILTEATCSSVGYKAYSCTVCGAAIDDTIEEIPINNKAHVVEEWTVTEESTLLHPTGSRYGFCTACNQNIVEETAFLPSVYDVSDRTNNPGGLTFPLSRYLKADVLDGDHFYPTDTNPQGKDFVFEMAILWNETMLNCATDECEIALLSGSSDPLYTFVPVNNGSGWCKFAGGFDFSSRTKTVLYGPASGDSQPRENYTFIGEYGWHKVAVRLHEEAAIKNNAVQYTLISYLYIDGTKVWELELKTASLVSNKNMLFYAEIDPADGTKLVYSDPDDRTQFRFVANRIGDSIAPMYFVFGDVKWRAVDADWTPEIEPVANPTPATYALSDTLTVPASVYFRAKTD